jgi:hypothetical protein
VPDNIRPSLRLLTTTTPDLTWERILEFADNIAADFRTQEPRRHNQQLYCTLHGSCAHSTANCRNLQNLNNTRSSERKGETIKRTNSDATEEACRLPHHFGHTNQQCRTQRFRGQQEQDSKGSRRLWDNTRQGSRQTTANVSEQAVQGNDQRPPMCSYYTPVASSIDSPADAYPLSWEDEQQLH